MRQGIPLIRYRTGDISRFLPGVCAGSTVLRRLEKDLCRAILERPTGCIGMC